MWVRIPLETYIFILNFSLPPRSEQVNGAVANEIKHVLSPEVIVVLDPRYDLSYKGLVYKYLQYSFKLFRTLQSICPSLNSSAYGSCPFLTFGYFEILFDNFHCKMPNNLATPCVVRQGHVRNITVLYITDGI